MGLGMPEVVLILVIALIVFGPRKLPELGKSLGQAMSQFRKASDDFKRTWEQEVEIDNVRKLGSSSHRPSDSFSTDPYESYSSSYESYYGNESDTEPEIAGQKNEEDTASVENQESASSDEVTSSAATASEKQHWI